MLLPRSFRPNFYLPAALLAALCLIPTFISAQDADEDEDALVSVPAALTGSCGVERWGVKTGTDADVGLIDMGSSSGNTITTMRSWPKPSPIPANNRIAPYETTVWVVSGTMTVYKAESDSDYHLVIVDGSGNSLIAEIPDPACAGAGSPFLAGITHARQQFNARYTATGSFKTANIPVSLTGIGMFDFLHGQTGVAPNGIELHPVLDILFDPSNPDFLLSASPGTVTALQGNSGNTTVTSVVTGGFSSAIDLTATGLPAGATASFVPTPITGAGTSTLTLTSDVATPPGTYPITITGTAGTQIHTTTVDFNVTSGTAPDFTISTGAGNIGAAQGGTGNTSALISPVGGFSSTVTLSASGLPAGVSAGFTPATLPGTGSSTLTLSATCGAVSGSYSVTVTGTSGGLTHSTLLGLDVTLADTPPSAGNTLRLMPSAACVGASHPVISQIQTGSASSASDEFVELYNPTSSPFDLTGFALKYTSAANNGGLAGVSFTAGTTIPANGYLLAASSVYTGTVAKDATMTAGMAAAAGHVYLVQGTTSISGCPPTGPVIIDRVGYGATASCPEGGSGANAAAPASGESIKRKPNDATGNGQDLDNNANDFTASSASTPRNHNTTVSCSVQGVRLDWATAAVDGYHLYRDVTPAMATQTMIGNLPVTYTTFIDTATGSGFFNELNYSACSGESGD